VVLLICRLRDQVVLGPEGVAGVLGRPVGEDRRRRPSEARLVFPDRVAQVHRYGPRRDLIAFGQIDRTTSTGRETPTHAFLSDYAAGPAVDAGRSGGEARHTSMKIAATDRWLNPGVLLSCQCKADLLHCGHAARVLARSCYIAGIAPIRIP
jgi:hypothetical protein